MQREIEITIYASEYRQLKSDIKKLNSQLILAKSIIMLLNVICFGFMFLYIASK